MLRIARIVLLCLLILLASCGLPGTQTIQTNPEAAPNPTLTLPDTAIPSPEVTAPVTEPPDIAEPTLKPPDSDEPVAGICSAPPDGELVVITIRPDVPDPRCIQAHRHQRLMLVNETGVAIQATLGGYQVSLEPGEEGDIDKALGEYLQPGVHFIQTTTPGTGGELILLED